MKEANVIAMWGTEKQYFTELEKFYEQHRDADRITLDNESGIPISAVYLFKPTEIYNEREAFFQKLREEQSK